MHLIMYSFKCYLNFFNITYIHIKTIWILFQLCSWMSVVSSVSLSLSLSRSAAAAESRLRPGETPPLPPALPVNPSVFPFPPKPVSLLVIVIISSESKPPDACVHTRFWCRSGLVEVKAVFWTAVSQSHCCSGCSSFVLSMKDICLHLCKLTAIDDV